MRNQLEIRTLPFHTILEALESKHFNTPHLRPCSSLAYPKKNNNKNPKKIRPKTTKNRIKKFVLSKIINIFIFLFNIIFLLKM